MNTEKKNENAKKVGDKRGGKATEDVKKIDRIIQIRVKKTIATITHGGAFVAIVV